MLVDVRVVVRVGQGQGRLVGEQPRQSVAQQVERRGGQTQGWGQLERQTDRRDEVVGVVKGVTRVTAVKFIIGEIRSLLFYCDRGWRVVVLDIILIFVIDQACYCKGFLLGLFCLRGDFWWTGRQR